MTKRCLAIGAALLGLWAALPASADEIWIAPGEKGDIAVGDWGLTPTGEAHFTFAVPESLDGFVGAQVMVIGKKNRSITYDLHLSISRDGASQNAFSADATGQPATLSTDKLTALDASALFPALAAGEDVVALHFRASPQGDLRVVGLRFEFERFPDQAGLACGPGQFLVGFEDVTGDPVCKTLAEVTGGGGDDGLLIGINNVELPEGQAGTTPFVFTVELSGASATPVTVDFSTRNNTAQAGTDYIATSGTVTFAPGEVTKPITVQVIGDTTPEPIETFFLDLTNATGGASIGDPEGLGRIFSDDPDGDPGGGRDD